jgi:hypothetical protein
MAVFTVAVDAAGMADHQPAGLAVAQLAVGAAFLALAARLLTVPRGPRGDTPRWLTSVDEWSRAGRQVSELPSPGPASNRP